MKIEELRGKGNKVIGILQTRDHITELKASGNKLLGTYNSKNNETKDTHGNLIGKGNLLTTLLR